MKQICINSGGLPESQNKLRGPGTVADPSHRGVSSAAFCLVASDKIHSHFLHVDGQIYAPVGNIH